MRIRGIVFDMDGVLLLSSDIHAEAFRQVLAPLGITAVDYRRIAGMRTDDALRLLLSSREDIAELAARKSELARKMIAERRPVAPECTDLIPALAAKYSLALASSASAASVELFLEITGLSPYFQCILSGADVARAKPAPDIYTLACARLGLAPGECLVIEDAVSGVTAAKVAGAQVWGLAEQHGAADELSRAGANRVVASLKELYSVPKTDWTVLIAAAGRGTRLGFDKPKILFPVAGVTILERLVNLFAPLCDNFVFVLSPDGAPIVRPYLQSLRAQIAIQSESKGMGDAVACGAAAVRTPYVAIVWGDQFALRNESLETCMRILERNPEAEVVCPTLLRDNPYIHFERDAGTGRLLTVQQKREGDELPPHGESDSGVFFFRTAALRSRIAQLLSNPAAHGRQTRELNFLPVFPLIDATPNALLTPQIMTEAESVGINSPEDVAWLEARCR